MAKQITREQWLNAAVREFRQEWRKLGVDVPEDVRTSCGFPGGGSPRKRIGECWPRGRSAAGVNEVFINPTQASPRQVLDVLGHELLHAADDCKSKHGGVFTRLSKKVGYSGGKHSHAESDGALQLLSRIENLLGAFPHGELKLSVKTQKESDGLHKFECHEHKDVLYSTAKKVEEFGIPHCRECGEAMQLSERQKRKLLEHV